MVGKYGGYDDILFRIFFNDGFVYLLGGLSEGV